MMDMVTKAIERINGLMQVENNRSIAVIGEFLIQYVRVWPQAAEALCSNDKDLKGAYKAIESYARSLPRTGNGVAVSPDDGFEQVLKYYGIHVVQPELNAASVVGGSKYLQGAAASAQAPAQVEEAEQQPEEPSFTLSLADLL